MEQSIYQENILEHYRNPHNHGALSGATHTARGHNASCGDSFTWYFKVSDGRVEDVSFEGEGCALSTAASSLLSDLIKGKTLDELKALTPGHVYDALRIEISGGRARCALLPYEALSEFLKNESA